MKIKCTMLLAVSLCATPFLAQAADLKITNNTPLASTCIINDGGCSTKLGAIGTTPPNGATNTIPQEIVNKVCSARPSACKADVFLSPNCNSSGAKPIATVIFDTQTGIQSVTQLNPAYKIVGTGFNITLNPA